MGVTDKSTLNPKLWDTSDQTLLGPVRQAILERADSYVQKLGYSPNDIEDVRLVGGNASFNYTDASDLDVTIMLNRKLNLQKEDVRRLGIASANLNYRLSPSLLGIPLNFYMSHRNLGSIRPAKQSVYSLGKNKFLIGPTRNPELEPNFVAGKAAYFANLIEACVEDDSDTSKDCAAKLLKRLKAYRVKGLSSKDGEFSTENLVWRVLSRSNYISVLKDRIERLEKDFYRIQSTDLLECNDFRQLINNNSELDATPVSILKWSRRLLTGESPLEMLDRVRPIVALFLLTGGLKEPCGCE